MPAFKFRLQFLINLRRQKEEEAALKLAKRLASIAELEENIESMHVHLLKLAGEITDHGQKGRLTGPLLKLYSDFQNRLRQDIKKAEELLILSRREEAKERQALTKAVMDRQVIEKLKDQKQEAFILETLYLEQMNLEEQATAARVRYFKEAGTNDAS
jgi:flagellar FliJ protein